MSQDNRSLDRLKLPADEIGWSDESFDLAVRYVMATTNIVEVQDMQVWLKKNVAKDIFWSFAVQVPSGIFKRPILLSFRSFDPSAMERAYDHVKHSPPSKHLKLRIGVATVINAIFIMLAITAALFLILGLIGQALFPTT